HDQRARPEAAMHERLVPTVAPQQKPRRAPAHRTILGNPGREWRLAGPAGGGIADRDRGEGQARRVASTGRPHLHDDPIQARERYQRYPRHASPARVAPDPLDRSSQASHSSPPYVTLASSRSALAIPSRMASFPSPTPNGALYTMSTVANGLGTQNRSHDSIHQAEDARAPDGSTSALACCAAANAPGFMRSAGGNPTRPAATADTSGSAPPRPSLPFTPRARGPVRPLAPRRQEARAARAPVPGLPVGAARRCCRDPGGAARTPRGPRGSPLPGAARGSPPDQR